MTPEEQAREIIDSKLAAAGWTVQSLDELNLTAAPGVAVCEVRSTGGPADYILFVEGKAIGVVEAKKLGTTLSTVAEQSKRYSVAHKWIPQRWADPLPFTFESTGEETNFRDQRDPDSRSREVFAFHTPEHLLELVKQPDTLRSRLTTIPTLEPATLRDCQIDAITHLEKSLGENRPRSLIQMATGSGKTYLAVNQVYRLIKHAGAKRILFLVDRANLGRQTINEFQQFTTPDDGRKFTELYNVQMLGPAGIDPVCKVTVSTIQRLYSQLMNNEPDDEIDEQSGYELDGTFRKVAEASRLSSSTGNQSQDGSATLPVSYNPAIPIETFDFVIIDECHRSIYNLWKQVLEYFDAFLIGLTATPGKATFGFFDQNLVTEYPHFQAVADGVNVGYDIYRIKTQISEEGTKLEAGFDYRRRDRLTRAKRWAVQDEEESIARTQLDRSVVVPDQIRTVIQSFREKLFTDLFPERSGDWVPKTLIFAKTDSHAEDIVKIVREEFGKGNDFCKKVTYKAGAKPEDIIKAFRTAPEFRIAVTVDMIATGTDIKPLECLLFLRDVRSQLYFEQMKGRGTRTINPTDLATVTPDAGNKTRFVLVDAVGVTESDKTDSRPMERKPTVAFEKLLTKIAMGERDEDTLTSVANRLARLDRTLTDTDKAELEVEGGISVKKLASDLLQATDPDRINKVAEASRLSSPEAQQLHQQSKQTFTFLNTEAEITKTHGAYLPHWHQDGVIYFVTFRLADSLPQEKLDAYREEKQTWLTQNPEPHDDEQKQIYHERFPQRIQQWLDLGYGSMILRDQQAKQIVINAITHFDGDRYKLDEFVVAANHVHVLVAPQGDHTLSDIMHSWKSFTSKKILKLPAAERLTTAPTVWQKESWDHIVRSEASLEKFREYIRAHVAEASRLLSSMEDQRRDAAATLATEAAQPIATKPAFRKLLEKKRCDREMTIDHISGDKVLETGYDEEKARGLIENWQQFLEDNQDEITALQILYNKPHAKRHLVYEELKVLRDAVGKPPYHIAPAEVWKAYEHLEKLPLTSDPVKTLTNLITLVRHTVDPEHQPLAPFPKLVEQRYQQWLAQHEERFDESQLHWLDVIKNYISLNGAFATEEKGEYLDAWKSVDSDEGVPLAVAKRVFGKDPKLIIEELNEVLVA